MVPSRAVVKCFVPDVIGTLQHGLKYSQRVIEAATKFCRSLRARARARA